MDATRSEPISLEISPRQRFIAAVSRPVYVFIYFLNSSRPPSVRGTSTISRAGEFIIRLPSCLTVIGIVRDCIALRPTPWRRVFHSRIVTLTRQMPGLVGRVELRGFRRLK
jgi:hypothetical protein